MAGILWKLLPRSLRQNAAIHLSLRELESLNQAWKDHRFRSQKERIETERTLQKSLHPRYPVFLVLYGIALAAAGFLLFLIHFIRFPHFSWDLRMGIFSPLLLGMAAPLLAAVLPAWRLRILFRFRTGMESLIYLLPGFLGTLWIIAFIRMTEPSVILWKPDGFSLFVLFLGAISAPLLEEIFFRELIPGLFGKSPHWLGHIISALLFSAAHIPSGAEMSVYYFLSGLLLSVIRIGTGRLAYPFLLHSIANGIMVFL